MSTRVTIGEFSRLTHLTVKTLHHYHDIELLVPAEIDRSSGYRRYSLDQVDDALLIHRLRELQMPLPLVQEAVRATDDATQKMIISDHLRRMESALERTRDVVASLRSMIESPTSPAPISHDWQRALRVLAIREVVDRDVIGEWCADAFPKLYIALQHAGHSPTGPGGGCYSEEFFASGRAEVMAFVPAATAADEHRWPKGIETLELPAGNFASTEHRGPLIDFDRSYARLGNWVNAHDLTTGGPIRESYLISPADTDDASTFVTRLSWPITGHTA